MQPFRVPRTNRVQIQGGKCPPKGAIGQALPRGKPMHLVITAHPTTGHPMALEVRNLRAQAHKEVPIRCQQWLSAGTIVSGTVVQKGKSVWYVFHDIHQLGGRWLREASHRERLGTLLGFYRAIDGTGMGNADWPKHALATLLPEANGVTAFAAVGVSEVGYQVRQVQHKVLDDIDTVYVAGAETAPAVKANRGIVLSTRRPNRRLGSSGSSGATSPPVPASVMPAKATKHAKATKPAEAAKPAKPGRVCKRSGEVVVVTAGGAGPDDYYAVDKSGKRAGPLHVSSLSLSLKLNQLLRGHHCDLYRPPGPIRVLREMSLPCVWESKHQRWCPELEAKGTKAKTTYPVRMS